MADQLYLSLWFPNFRLESLPSALTGVMRQFALVSEAGKTPSARRVAAAAAFPISFSEAPTYQRLYVNDTRSEEYEDTSSSIIETAVAEATEQLHDDMAYEFEMKWNLWTPDSGPGSPGYGSGDSDTDDPEARLDVLWRPHPSTVRIIGFGPRFDEGDSQQNGHIRVDFGLDYPWVLDDEDPQDEEHELDEHTPDHTPDHDHTGSPRPKVIPFASGHPADADPDDRLSGAAQYIQKNIENLLAFTLSVEKNCGISSRLLWTESGEPLAEKLIARLQRLN